VSDVHYLDIDKGLEGKHTFGGSSFSFSTGLRLSWVIDGPSDGSMLLRANSSNSILSTSFSPNWYVFNYG